MDKLAALFSIPMHKLSEMFSILMLNLSKLLQFAQPKSGHQKIKGFVVLQKKNVLDFNDFFAGIGDNLGELVGKAVSFQLVSTSQIDSSDGMGKLSNIALLQKWIFSPQGVVAGQTNHGIEFDWDSNLGPPGAFFITNSHRNQFFLKSVTLEVPGHGNVHFDCNSWVYPASRYKRARVFFSNRSYLPATCPLALIKLRNEELINLRGEYDGMAKTERKQWDRVYDYDFYNDLGNPDKNKELSRPVLGGSQQFPYPRRVRTGRPRTKKDPASESRLRLHKSLDIYVPRDERFGHLKMSDFLAHSLKAVVQFLVPELKSLFDSTINEFDSFQDIKKLYSNGIKVPNNLILEAVKNLIPFELIKEFLPTDGEKLLKYPLPEVIGTDEFAWRKDEEFAREMLAGVDPLVIQRLQNFPPKSNLNPKGFLSIDCGGKTNQSRENNIKWVTDANYIDVGQTGEIGNASASGSYLHTLRVFPKPLNKSCYQLPVLPNVPYLLRLWFAVGNYSGFKQLPSFAFSIETLGMLAMGNVTISKREKPVYNETIFVSSGRVLYICLIRTSEPDDPFISAIELRTLQPGMYGQAKPGTMLMSRWRYDAGGKSRLRYPKDKFDRIWENEIRLVVSNSNNDVDFISSEEPISTNNTKELPPTVVMQTAEVCRCTELSFSVEAIAGHRSLLLLYFAEIRKLNMYQRISFSVTVNGENRSETITSLSNYSTLERAFISNQTDDLQFSLVSTSNGTIALIINAFEAYKIVDTRPATYAQDVKALEAIKSRFGIKDWISDPCFLIQWKGIVCKSNISPIRISEIDLSGKNLTGLVPNDIGRLTALVKVSLDNNHLIGPLPNFSSLIMLERLYLQNNYLTGTFPNWLCELKNLKELNIENNNFSGEIPAQFLNVSLKFSYCGNPYLHMHKGECILHHRKKNKLKIVIGITLSGFLIIALALIMAIVVYRNKVGRKEQGADNERSGLGMERSSFFSQDHSMVVVPNPTKSRVFTLKEMIAATQTFSHEIGRGGFGSVFLGKLPQGEDIAVKVLSQSSQQGVHEFLNEVDLLSRIHHRNLVSLLGYCNETREVMLIYDYMSGGSLRDHLYGPSAHLCKLNWRIRLKIALDAAQGLEYLHVGCTPNIIHRDIKTANILLDSDLNGKLADFGLSKMTTDGEATHVTTAIKGTAGYLDPEYFSTWMLTHKSDVYSFGVVLLEIICGRQPIDLKLPAEELNIIRWVTPYVLDIDNPCKITKIIDKRLGGGYDMISVTAVAKLAMRCVQPEPSSRPSVTEVAAELREAIKHDDRASISISEEIGIESSDLLSGPVSLSVDSSGPGGMEWSDISTISQVGEMSSHCVE